MLQRLLILKLHLNQRTGARRGCIGYVNGEGAAVMCRMLGFLLGTLLGDVFDLKQLE